MVGGGDIIGINDPPGVDTLVSNEIVGRGRGDANGFGGLAVGCCWATDGLALGGGGTCRVPLLSFEGIDAKALGLLP